MIWYFEQRYLCKLLVNLTEFLYSGFGTGKDCMLIDLMLIEYVLYTVAYWFIVWVFICFLILYAKSKHFSKGAK